jgi:Site-specific recombinase XerD
VNVTKLPNKFGSVYKLSGNRRRPYIARKTTGWSDEGKQLYLTVGYYETKEAALIALSDFNNNPYDLGMSKTTFAEIYRKWFEDTFDDGANRSTVKNYNTSYNHCSELYDLKMSDIRPHHMQSVIDKYSASQQAAVRIKILLNKLFIWCIHREYIRKNYAKHLSVPKQEQKSERRAFTKEHIALIWEVAESNPNIPIVLMLLYSGVRISELLDLKKDDVNLEEQWFKVRKSKTNAGIRVVPIADKVLSYWKAFMERSRCEYAVCTTEGARLTYDNFRKRYWHPLMDKLNMDYIPHETRHTCNSLLIMADINQTIRMKIMGHKSQMDIGERVYGHIYVEELLKAINQI